MLTRLILVPLTDAEHVFVYVGYSTYVGQVKPGPLVAMVTVHQTRLHYLREIGVAAMIEHRIAISAFG